MLSLDIQVETEPDRTIVRLPLRKQTSARWIGCMPIGFGLFFSGFALVWICGAAGFFEKAPMGPEGPLPPHPFDWTRLLFALFGVPFFFAGFAPMLAGLAIILPSRAEIVISNDRISSTNRFGPFRISQRRPIAKISRLRIADKTPGVQSTPGTPMHGIQADCDGQKALYLAQRYHISLLDPLADFLAGEINRRRVYDVQSSEQIRQVTVDRPAKPETAAESAATPAVPVREADQPAPPAQPAGSKIQFVGAPDSLTFAVPRTGLRGVALFFVFFSLIWDGISFPMFVVFLVDAVRHPAIDSIFPVLFLLLFVVIGVGMALAAIQTAFRRAVILATRDSLVVTQQGPIRNAEYQWKPAELKAIRADYSGTTINNRRLRELQFHLPDGVKHGFMDGRDDAELEWLASTLRAFYSIPASAS